VCKFTKIYGFYQAIGLVLSFHFSQQMIVFKTKEELTDYLSANSDACIGFVPTMGALHKGHLALLNEAKKQTSLVVCSIFVNPTQFNNQNDFKSYPKTIAEDLTLLEKINCDVAYLPEIADFYKEGEKAKKYDFGGLENDMEGKFRKGHFDGVATIIEKFFNIIKPQKAFFGQKDLQQLLIVKLLTKKLELSTEIIPVPTIREENELAMSSRNKLLNKQAFNKARLLYQSLLFCKKNKDGLSFLKMKEKITTRLSKEKIELEYLTFTDSNSLQIITEPNPKGRTAVCIAAYIDGVRLIDNIIF
jgi:pantoate--beta-alanine ligase